MRNLEGAAVDVLARYWWTFILRGILAVLFGIVAWAWPGLTLTTLLWLTGIWLVIDGIFAIIAAIVNRKLVERLWPLILIGLAGILFGIFIVAFPGFTVVWLIVTIGFYAIVSGISAIFHAIRLRKEIDNEWSIGLFGLLSVVFGVIMVAFPGAGALSLIWVIAIYAIAIGITEIIFGFRIRGKGSDA